MAEELAPGEIVAQGDPSDVNGCVLSSPFQDIVCLTLKRRADRLTLTAEDARVMGEQLLRQSYRARFGDFPTTVDKSAMTEQLRIRARNRVETMMRSMLGSPHFDLKVNATSIADAVIRLCT